jgi:hypothetical protein
VICKAHAITRSEETFREIVKLGIAKNSISISCRDGRDGRIVYDDLLTNNEFSGEKIGQFKSINRANGIDQVFTPTFEGGKIVKYSMTEKPTLRQKFNRLLGLQNQTQSAVR